MKKNDTTRLYGFTKDWDFPYFCFGKKCYMFKIAFGKKDKKFHKYYGKMTSDEVLHTMVHNHNHVTFFGIMRVPWSEMYNLFNN